MLGAVFLRCITIFMAPINMRILNPDDYGKLALINSFISISVAIAGLGLRQALSLEYFHCAGIRRKQLVNDIVIIYSLIILPLFFISIVFRPIVSRFFFLGQISSELIIISFIIIILFFFVELFYQILQYEQQAFRLTILQTIVALITAAGIVILLWYLHYGFGSIIVAQLFGMILAFIIAVHSYIKHGYYSNRDDSLINKKLKKYLKLGLPFVPNMLFALILASGDRWILARYSSLHNVGIYSIADTFSQLFQFLVLYPWSGSYLPYILNSYAHNKDNLLAVERRNQRLMYVSMIGCAILITVIFLMTKTLLGYILPPSYHEALQYIWLLLMGQIFLLGNYFASSFIQYHKKSYFLAFSLYVPALLNIGLNIILIPSFAIYGCVVATVFSYAVYWGITLGYNHYIQKQG
jgi:O-antigen/teichoic acid export membrane protein